MPPFVLNLLANRAFWVLSFFGVVILTGNHAVSLWDQDEAAYAGFGRTMIETGNWLIPEFMWSDVHRKPPLHFWLVAVSFKLFGVNEFALRIPSSLAIWGTLMMMYVLGGRLVGARHALTAVCIAGSSFLLMALAKVAVTDAVLLFFTTLSAFSMVLVLREGSYKWVAIFWFAVAMAMLTKGPPVILFAGVFGALLFVASPQRLNLLRLHPWFFLPIAILPLFGWGWLCYQSEEGKDFIQWMLDWYILKRIGGSVFGQTGPPGTHLIGMVLFFLPFFLFLPRAMVDGFRSLYERKWNNELLITLWFIAGWLLFEFTPSKLPAYVVAAHIPLSFMLAGALLKHKDVTSTPKIPWWVAHYFLQFVLLTALAVLPFYLGLSLGTKVVFLVVVLLLSGLHSYGLTLSKKPSFYSWFLKVPMVFALLVWGLLLPMSDDLKNSSLRMANYLSEQLPPEAPVVIANNWSHPPSLPFYLTESFDTVFEAYDPETLVRHYRENERIAIILNEQGRMHFEQALTGVKFKAFYPVFTDRLDQPGYFIVVK